MNAETTTWSTATRKHEPRSDARPLTRRDVMSVPQVAEILGCSKRQVYLLAARDELPGVRRLGRTVLVVRPVLEQWLLSGSTDEAQ